ncbi:hypothetical protein F5Y16DRAFT_110701 [Xylariaceae sp. FL0255]|nr:hypothetical protein F5Y16DRAFT_110701 [Xylariaceae sp. FL0255]
MVPALIVTWAMDDVSSFISILLFVSSFILPLNSIRRADVINTAAGGIKCYQGLVLLKSADVDVRDALHGLLFCPHQTQRQHRKLTAPSI